MAARPGLYDGCPTAHALDLIGDRWALLVVRELLIGPKRFTDLVRGLPKISRNVLSQRLDDLEAAKVLKPRALAPPSSSTVYELTPRGLELESVLQAIGRWGAASPLLPDSDTLGADTFVLGLRGHFEEAAAQQLTAEYELRIGADVFSFAVDRGRLSVRRGECAHPDARLEVDPAAMVGVARGMVPLASALTATDEGNVARFAELFRTPERMQPAQPGRD